MTTLEEKYYKKNLNRLMTEYDNIYNESSNVIEYPEDFSKEDFNKFKEIIKEAFDCGFSYDYIRN